MTSKILNDLNCFLIAEKDLILTWASSLVALESVPEYTSQCVSWLK